MPEVLPASPAIPRWKRQWIVAGAIAALSVVLTSGSLWAGWRLDDYYQRWIILGSPVYTDVGRNPWDAFCFVDGDPARNQRMMTLGMLPWWTDPHVKVAFWKPFTVLTHRIDYALWPNAPILMHAQSLFWYGLWIYSVCLLYQRTMRGSSAATLAGLLYAVDHSRAVAVGWLANRNAVLAALFGVLAIHAHIQSRRRRSVGLAILSPMSLLICLLSAETGIGAAAYLFAYALTLDRAGCRRGLLSLWPHAVVIAGWRWVWSAQGYGVHAVDDLYSDPAASPVIFAQWILQRGPLYLLGQWTGIPAEIHWAVSERAAAAMSWSGILVMVVISVALAPLLRRSRIARFWGLGMILATIPMCSAAPMNRHLVFIGIGAMGLLGQFLASAWRRRFWRGSLALRAVFAVLVFLMVVVHLVLAPLGLAVMARYPLGPDSLAEQFQSLPAPPEADRDLVFVNHPLPMDMLHWFSARAVDHGPLPRCAQVLSPASTAVVVLRTDDHSLLLRPDSGFFLKPASRLGYVRDNAGVHDREIELPLMTVKFVEWTPDGRPAAVLFRFRVPLEDKSLQWICWEDGQFHKFRPPPVGSAVQLPASGLPF